MARTWLRAAAVGAAALALAACGSGGQEAQSRPARGIAVDVGGRLAVLDGLDSEPRIVGERPPDTELLDGYHLAGARQLDRGLTVGIRQDTAMVVSTRDPMRAVMVGPAAALFPGTDGRRVWTVTEESPDTACAGQQLPATVRARYTAADHDTEGRPARRTVTLPCGFQPVGETVEGLVAEQTVGDRQGPSGAVARTRVVLMDRDGAAAARTVADSGTVLGAAGRRLLWRSDDCADASCTQLYDTLSHSSAPAPTCTGGRPVGRGVLDPTGRWYATLVRGDGASRLAVLDLDQRVCRDAGPVTGRPQDGDDLGGALTVGWSGGTLLVLDAGDGSLRTADARTGATGQRSHRLELGDGAQVWGALPA
ncbi:hypothetical protein GCM10010441_73790 [Kitasatospora paracochleata]|uniref:Lipoprotein n=1 Tax=Kitasatospora paracochleata TaxID=58354 RepID=A0ABT1IX31_9ACTN|nr:hypothetical protein [Kitasatospora paracochleata]MCP2309705.1 hypothetical protein [Kitasatospora paracochleata]